MDALTRARVGLDLGAPVMEQLVLARLLDDADTIVEEHRRRLREQRDRLAAALTEHLPEWRFRLPAGGLAMWCELPAALGTAVADEADRLGVIVAPGPAFAVEGGLDRSSGSPGPGPATCSRRRYAGWRPPGTGSAAGVAVRTARPIACCVA